MTAPTPNADLAYRVLDQIDAYPKSWDQGLWVGESPECGTIACFAGWACLLSDVSMRDEFVLIDGEEIHVEEAAESLLGIGHEDLMEHGDLFCGLNSRERLGQLVAEIFGPRPGGES